MFHRCFDRCPRRLRWSFRMPAYYAKPWKTPLIFTIRHASAICLALILAIFSASWASAGPLPSIEAVRAGYTQSVSAIRTLDCRYRVSCSSPEIEKSLSSQGTESKPLSWYEIQHVRDGAKVAVLFESGSQPNVMSNRFWAMFDGKGYASWTQSTKNGDGTFLPAGDISHIRSPFLDLPCLIQKFWGTEVYSGFDLKDLLARPQAQVVSREMIGNVQCVVVDLGEHARNTRDSRLISTKVWFDRENGFLPRQIVIKAMPEGTICFELSVQEIAVAKDQLTDALVYLPTKGSTQISTSSYTVDVVSFQLNQPIPLQRFQPEFPQGAEVIDLRSGSSPKIYFIGGIDARNELSRKLAKTQAANRPPVPTPSGATSAPSATVRPIAESPWFKGLGISGFCILGLVSVYCARRFWHRT